MQILNVLFDKGIFLENWTDSIVLPMYKKGDANNPNNQYRGISLCDANNKLYNVIINKRLLAWMELNNITGEFQAGLKQNYSTTDDLFTLIAFVQKQFCLNRKLYVAFIYFEKAFNSINRSILWPIWIKNSIRGKMYRCVMTMYDCVKARLRCGATLTDCINCTAGVKQGDVCSPILFSLFINELTLEVINAGRNGATFANDLLENCILLLADAVVLINVRNRYWPTNTTK